MGANPTPQPATHDDIARPRAERHCVEGSRRFAMPARIAPPGPARARARSGEVMADAPAGALLRQQCGEPKPESDGRRQHHGQYEQG
jgi:hypothetical protein